MEKPKDSAAKPREGQIWAMAGGKGGTGKTFLLSSMGIHLAKRQNSVILVDFDLGGANLHSFFNLAKPSQTLTRFFDKTGAPLGDLAVPTGVDNMSLISGDLESISSDNITFSQKLKLFRQMMKLHTQYILIDLGAGCHNNTLDTFLIADKMITLVIPEITAVENMYHFIKSVLYRKLKMTLKAYGFKDTAQHLWQKRESLGLTNIKEFIDYLRGQLVDLAPLLDKELAGFKVYIVVNMTRDNQDILLGASLKSLLHKFLGVQALYAGYVEHDDAVWRSIRERRPFMLNYLANRSSKEIEILVENLIQDKEVQWLWS
jgi:flagellar biosynthesis protein FlhG